MSNEVKEIANIIRHHFYKDISDTILKTLFYTCGVCGDLFKEEEIIRVYDGSCLCIGCYNYDVYMICGNCKLNYDLTKAIFCCACATNCRIYCNYCLSSKYKELDDSIKEDED